MKDGEILTSLNIFLFRFQSSVPEVDSGPPFKKLSILRGSVLHKRFSVCELYNGTNVDRGFGYLTQHDSYAGPVEAGAGLPVTTLCIIVRGVLGVRDQGDRTQQRYQGRPSCADAETPLAPTILRVQRHPWTSIVDSRIPGSLGPCERRGRRPFKG